MGHDSSQATVMVRGPQFEGNDHFAMINSA